ncbi:hypothetical protein HORIV_66270 [Vreelandella olivaria]|uniref:Serine hydroxymethyltransferase-like domain-containing protein n=1 Tax=Vreelandella olivaria TaxID=390919 RepID=A0ABN5X4T9_9GAMM|nr:hypothetical protein HORIV_66270 [Halomonas olivaria]
MLHNNFSPNARLASYDTLLAEAIAEETARQEAHIELIASENYTSKLVMEAQGTQLTNKYAEGYPGRRYYGGCEFVDKVEALAIERACHLLVPIMPTCSRTPGPRPMPLCLWPWYRRAIPYWV